MIPPAYGLQGIHSITSTGDGEDIAYWNRYVAVTQMGGHGSFIEPRTGVSVTNGTDDLVSGKLPALQAYQLSLAAPAAAGRKLRSGRGRARRSWSSRAPAAVPTATAARSSPTPTAAARARRGRERAGAQRTPSYASRSATKQYRTAPLKGLWQHAPYFHNGSAATPRGRRAGPTTAGERSG